MIYILEEISGLDSILYFISNILKIVRILVPIGLIVFISIDLGKAVLSKDDDALAKAVKSIKNRVIACIIIFFLPVFVQYLLNNISTSIRMDSETYNKILSSFNKVINQNEININDNTKDKAVSNSLDYNMDNIQEDTSNNELLINNSKKITNSLFSKESNKTLSTIACKGKCNITYNSENVESIYFSYDELVVGDIVNNKDYTINNIILNNVVVNDKDKYNKVVIDYYYNTTNNKLEYIKIISKDKIEDYLSSIKENEYKDIISTSKYISSNDNYYDYSKLNKLTDTDIMNIYTRNINNIVMINTYFNSAVVSSGSGFFISNGVIVTSWSFLKKSIMNGQTIIVHDVNKNAYSITGVILINVDNDIVVLKLNKQVNRYVTIGDYSLLNKNDPVITITSKTGYNFSTVTGIISDVSSNIVSVIPLSNNDWGSPLFNTSGQVVGMNTSKVVSGELSVATPTILLKELQTNLKNTNYNNIKIKSLEDIKEEFYYIKDNVEIINNSIDKKVWNKYKKIGDIENSIVLDLVKASYYDKVISLRYENNIGEYINTMDFANDFIANLTKSGYKNIMDTTKKVIYKKGNTKVIIMEEFDYLIIILAKESIL